MASFERISIALKAAKELGFKQAALYAFYRLALISGYLRLLTPPRPAGSGAKASGSPLLNIHALTQLPLTVPAASDLRSITGGNTQELLKEADFVASGKFRLYGGELVELDLTPPAPLRHWSFTNDNDPSSRDIKDLWEPARFGWVYLLGRAYIMASDEAYAKAFWHFFELFTAQNPPNLGPHWASGQEVALRLMALAFAGQVFRLSPHSSPERQNRLLESIGEHAARIPPALVYGRAQNNNHLLTKAAGLITAGALLEGQPGADRWSNMGWRWINHALQNQISPGGSYIQQSTNYHRLMLEASLWVFAVTKKRRQAFPPATHEKLVAATRWLLCQLDPLSGCVPNLGHNDGAHILPLAAGGFKDYRPVIQAASRAFLAGPCLPPGPWDELSLWLGFPLDSSTRKSCHFHVSCPDSPRLGDEYSWGSLRAARFFGRPAHADQLHVELWWKGHNVARDAGTYRYTALPPWKNSLAETLVHNTLTIDNHSQMRRAGRFLWVDWAHASRLLPGGQQDMLLAEHNGYRALGIRHRRSLRRLDSHHWLVQDLLYSAHRKSLAVSASLHWLLPDWPWEIENTTLTLRAPEGRLHLRVLTRSRTARPSSNDSRLQLVRAGEVVFGFQEELPTLGWYSPTYAAKIPALSLRLTVGDEMPFEFRSEWEFCD